MGEADVFRIDGLLPHLQLGESLVLPTYFPAISLALIASLIYLIRRSDSQNFSRTQTLDIALLLMISGFVGARLFHVLIEEPRYYSEEPGRIWEIWRGGFVWYGGALLGALTAVSFIQFKAYKDAQPLARWLDLFAPVCALGYALGRTSCFLVGCCFGQMGEVWGHSFRHPTQLYAIVFELCTFIIVLRLESLKRRSNPPILLINPGQVFLSWVALHAVGRMVMEHFRSDPRGPAPLGLSPATWISGILLIGSAFTIWQRRASSLSESNRGAP